MSLLNTMIGTAYLYSALPTINFEKHKKDVRQRWRDSMLLPRKKKKAMRKRLLKEWEMLCWGETVYSFN